MKKLSSLSVAWMVFNALALAASLNHLFIDLSIGLFGKSSSIMSPLQAANFLLTCLVYAYWLLSMGWVTTSRIGKSALLNLLILSIGWSFFANGVAVLVACPPPCQGAFPYQDITHISNVILGGFAAYTTWQTLKTNSEPINWLLPISTVALMLVAFGVQSALTLSLL